MKKVKLDYGPICMENEPDGRHNCSSHAYLRACTYPKYPYCRLALTLKMGQSRPLFLLFSSFQTNITILTTNECKKMFIQYTAPGFELTTF